MMMMSFFFFVRGCVLIILYTSNITLLHYAILCARTRRNVYISMIVFICLNCCFCKRVRWVCVVDVWNSVFVCGQVLDGVLSYDDDNHFVKRNVYWFGDGEFY